MAEKIRLCVVSRMRDDQGQWHETKNARRGTIETVGGGVRLEYDDEQDGERAHIVLTADASGATMQRKGMVSALLTFTPGKRIASRYVTMYGDIPVAVDTRRVMLSGGESEGTLLLDYDVYVSGDKTAQTLLSVQWKA